MKRNNLFVYGTLLTLSSAFFVGINSYADTDYSDSIHAKSEAIIQFEKDDSPVDPVDPDDPNVPVNPVNPPNKNGGELMITYASNLNFGTHKKTETSFYAQGDELKNGNKITPFVSIKDSRDNTRKGWSLTAKIDGDFADSSGNILKGAELHFSNLYSGNGQTNAPEVTQGDIVLNKNDEEIAKAGVNNGVGLNSIGLGKLDTTTNTTNGVKLTVPGSIAKDTEEYKTTVTYTLTADPTNP
ncbi:WxL domain-containing protein [Enterococcus faecium]|nr:WxL domain-containing protein [Enterococcus faecium]